MSGDEEDDWWEAQDQLEEFKKAGKVPASEYVPVPMSGKTPAPKAWKYEKPGKDMKVMDVLHNIGTIETQVESWIARVPSNSPFYTEAVLLMRRLVELRKQQVKTINTLVKERTTLILEKNDQQVFLDSLAQAEKEGRLSWTGMYFATSPVRLLAEGRVVTLDD